MPGRLLLLLFLSFFLLSAPVNAEPVRIETGVLADGAKFIGDKTGGAEITITDTATGKVLAQGITQGGTGSTDRIMGAEGGLYKNITSENDAVFIAELDLDAPLKVQVSARGPLKYPAAMATASKSVWLIPGKDYAGANRITLSLSGYIIEPLETAINGQGTGRLKVSLGMLCGCPVQPEGMWDANRMEKTATLMNKRGVEETVKLSYVEGTIFKAEFSGKVKQPDHVRVSVRGLDNDNAASLVIPLVQ